MKDICILDRRDAVQYLTLRRNVWDKRVFFLFHQTAHTGQATRDN